MPAARILARTHFPPSARSAVPLRSSRLRLSSIAASVRLGARPRVSRSAFPSGAARVLLAARPAGRAVCFYPSAATAAAAAAARRGRTSKSATLPAEELAERKRHRDPLKYSIFGHCPSARKKVDSPAAQPRHSAADRGLPERPPLPATPGRLPSGQLRRRGVSPPSFLTGADSKCSTQKIEKVLRGGERRSAGGESRPDGKRERQFWFR